MDTKLANEFIPVASTLWDPSTILLATFLATIALFSLVWGIHVKIRDAGIVDFFWGPGFALVAWLTIALSGGGTTGTLLLAGLITVWAVRLTAHMVWRHRHMDGEDARYAAMRRKGGPGWWWRSLFTLYWLQAAIQWVLGTPVHASLFGRTEALSPALLYPGLALFAVGMVLETVADFQLWRFKADPANRGRLMTEGLFAWSRHPNYFGETLVWWGFGLIAYADTGLVWALVGPALITLLLLKVSGVTLLDTHLAATKQGYADWAARTPAFVPRRPRPADDRGAAAAE